MIEVILQFLIRILNKWQNRESLKTFGTIRNPKWKNVRAEHLKKFSACALCGGLKSIEVHHIKPFNQHPELELSPENLITLCEAGTNGIVCHRAVGHLGNYRSWNTSVVNDVEYWGKKILSRP